MLESEIRMRRNKWQDALTSGNYSQYKGLLHFLTDRTEGFCCLGVACHIFKNEDDLVIRTKHVYDEIQYYDDIRSDWRSGFLPLKLGRYLGLSQNSQNILSCLNDKGVSFHIIGSVIQYLPIEEEGYEG